MEQFRNLIHDQHDVICNQKYANVLPYSFHLICVQAQGEKFLHFIEDEIISNPENQFSIDFTKRSLVRFALISHDVIEDARLTYNDLKELGSKYLNNSAGGDMLAEIVYCVTDEKGRNRKERKSEKYYKELSENELAVFVKLADISANTLFSKLTGSSMYNKYKIEFQYFKEMCYIEKYKEFFDYVESL